MEQFIMNNCKIANELRKYRDLTGCVNRVSLSDDPENYADYVITQELSYLDMVTANAVYSLWRSGEGENGFRAETIGQIMAGDVYKRQPQYSTPPATASASYTSTLWPSLAR